MASPTFEFTLWLADDPRDLLDWSNALYDAGADDSHPGVCNGELYATFHRNAATMEDAIRSARRQLDSIGLHVTRCEIPEAQLAVWA
ncbi:hypothetical protein [Planctellipticum variicoloris]|uniref:hypothetical protein n=1 Tax=Planctellipticum variicoloris TaxID=3064265 RepID=UPI003013E34D|nr:hypothetical protein SH412_001405 [Planctomycetaceae bacterium SH412]